MPVLTEEPKITTRYQEKTYGLEDKVKILTEKLLESYEELNILYDTSELLSSMDSVKDICDAALSQMAGIASLFEKANRQSFTAQDIRFLSAIAAQVAISIRNACLVADLKESFLAVINCLSMAIDAKSSYTHGHSVRVSEYASAISRKLGIPQEHSERLELACLLHDIGKIAIPEYILNKKERLSSEEVEIIRKYPIEGVNILRNIEQTKPLLDAIRNQHERYDGYGYPDGLAHEQIPLLARIIAVADAYDAMISDRPYRPKYSEEKTVELIREESGSMYDPLVIWAFNKWIMEKNL